MAVLGSLKFVIFLKPYKCQYWYLLVILYSDMHLPCLCIFSEASEQKINSYDDYLCWMAIVNG